MAISNLKVIIAGDAAGAVRAFSETKKAAESAAKGSSSAFDKGTSKVGGAFEKLGNSMSNFGLPFGNSLTQLGEKLDATDTKGKKFGLAMAEVGKGLALGVGVAAAGVILESFKMGVAFQTATASVAGHAGISIKAAQNMGNAFIGTAGKTEYSAQEMMTALAPVAGEIENLTGETLTTAQAMVVMKAATDLSTASGESLTTTTKALVDIMLPFKMNLSQSGDAANILWNTQRLLGVSTSDLQSTYERLTPFVAGANMSFGQLSGMIVELTHSLGGGRQAARVAGRAIQGIIDPSSKANKVLDSMNISLFDAQGHFIGMAPAIQKLKVGLAKLPGAQAGVAAEQRVLALTTQDATLKAETQTAGVKAQEKAIAGQLPILKLQAGAFSKGSAMQAIFGTNANAMLAIIAGGSPELQKYTSEVSKNGEVQKAAAKNTGTWQGQMHVLKASMEDLGAKIGTALLPPAIKVLKWFNKEWPHISNDVNAVGNVFSTVSKVIKDDLGWVTNSMGKNSSKMSKNMQEIGKDVKLLGQIFSIAWKGISGVFTAGVDLVTALWKIFGGTLLSVIGEALKGISGLLKGTFEIITGVFDVFDGLFTGKWGKMWKGVKDIFKGIWDAIVGIVHTAIASIMLAVGPIVDIISKISGAIGGLFGGGKKTNTHIMTKAVPHLAMGGIVTRPTLALVGEAGPEMVIPLNRGGGMSLTQPAGLPGGGAAAGTVVNLYNNPTIIVSATTGAPLAKQIQDAIAAENEKMIQQLQAHVA